MNLQDLEQIAATDAKAALMLARHSNHLRSHGASEAADRDAQQARECIRAAETALRVARAMRAHGYVDSGNDIILAA